MTNTEKNLIELVVSRFQTMPENLAVSIGSAGTFKKKDLIKHVKKSDSVGKKFTGDLEMLVVADTLGFKRIYEAPIKLDYALGDLTSAATLNAIWDILLDTLAIWYRKNILRYYQV